MIDANENIPQCLETKENGLASLSKNPCVIRYIITDNILFDGMNCIIYYSMEWIVSAKIIANNIQLI